ncbi:MAG: hydantoinase/oxoprolinase family protein, partial [Gaiellaceae bacterium]
AWVGAGNFVNVGPQSAGAVPGPACYGRGGTEPTVTDANVVLGRIGASSFLGGEMALDRDAAAAGIEDRLHTLGLDLNETAIGIVRLAVANLVLAVRGVSVERGYDPRDFVLVAFGGAGPMHAAALAEELGIERILCPRAGGVLSALGLLASERRRDTARTVMLSGDELGADRLAAQVASLRETIAAGMDGAETEAVYELRYRGQAFELPIEGSERPDPAELAERFAAEHERRYGYRDPEAEVELVNVRLALVVPGPEPELSAARAGRLERGSRRARFGGKWIEASVLRGEPAAGERAKGPCVFELPEATLVLPPGWAAEVDDAGTIVVERAG